MRRLLVAALLAGALLTGGPVVGKVGEQCAKNELKLDVNEFIDPNDTRVQAPSLVDPGVVPVVTGPPAPKVAHPLAPQQALTLGLTAKVASFAHTTVSYEGLKVHYVGLYLQRNPVPSPCIRTLVKVFAPSVIPNAQHGGQIFIKPAAPGEPRLEIVALGDELEKHGAFTALKLSAAEEPLLFDATETFYVLNLTKIEELRSKHHAWTFQVQLYENMVEDARAHRPAVQTVLFERFLLDLIRFYRYRPPAGTLQHAQLEQSIAARLAALPKAIVCPVLEREQDVDPPAPGQIIPRQCILLKSFLKTELGRADPFSVSDALGNSGLAVGPRQIDLGQLPEFGMKYLLSNEPEGPRRTLLAQYFASLERLSPYGLKTLYHDAIPTFNARLKSPDAQQAILDDFVTTLLQPLPAPAQLALIGLPPDQAPAFEAAVVDFSNKWAGATGTIAQAIPKRHYSSACEAIKSWIAAFDRSGVSAADLYDARRRANTVLSVFYSYRGEDTESCAQLLQPPRRPPGQGN